MTTLTTSGTRTVAHQVNRLVIDTGATFDNARRRYESAVPTIDFAKLTELSKPATWSGYGSTPPSRHHIHSSTFGPSIPPQ